jgi:DNA-binding GntR family transcriptional regulator
VSRNATQTEKAYNALKRAILQGEIGEGVFLSESDITKRFGIGRTPYREACNRLFREGILEAVPRRGYLVPELSFRAVRDLFEARLILEAAIAELAAAHGTEADVDELERLSGKPLPQDKPWSDYSELIRLNSEFHLRLARMTQNSELVRLLTNILEKHERLMYIELRSSRFPNQQTQMLHRPVVEALRRRDPAAAREAVIQDISQAQAATFGPSVWLTGLDGAGQAGSNSRDEPRQEGHTGGSR